MNEIYSKRNFTPGYMCNKTSLIFLVTLLLEFRERTFFHQEIPVMKTHASTKSTFSIVKTFSSHTQCKWIFDGSYEYIILMRT